MHLKTILIFSSICFFTGTMSQGLNAKQLSYFQNLVWEYHEIKTVKHGFSCIGIAENYNDCTLEEININDVISKKQRLIKILNCMVKVDKWGDKKKVEKLDINEVENISTKFRNFDIDNDGALNNTEFKEFIYGYELRDLIGNEVTLHDYKNVIKTLAYFRKDIDQKSRVYHDLSDVMLKLLEYKAKFNQTKFDKLEDLYAFHNKLYNISKGCQPEDFKSFHEE
ncbi:uncharacterized protein LOC126905648 [Daktulosphaira vitifoliae]|uniref:uncharacterized protein LOC126905648 n=1 Tax=Daktulosphaira vitifoliae TaxID=58002 RepID=UPI0021AA277B|nr:uncharacterized protein LOC126905648 [Daktulosphaira vitifoliae]